MGKFDIVLKSKSSSKHDMWFPEYFFALITASVTLDDRLGLDINIRKFNLTNDNKSYFLMIDDLKNKYFFGGIDFTPKKCHL